MQKILLAILSLVMLVGLAMSEDQLGAVDPGDRLEANKDVRFNYEDSSSGEGSYLSYNIMAEAGPHSDHRVQIRLAEVNLQKKSHGSGSIEKETIIKSTKSSIYIDDWNSYNIALISILGNSSMVYKPQSMSIGKGYYAINPVNFSSLLGDTILIKNHASETSMVHETKQAKGINMDLAASVEDDYSGVNNPEGLTKTSMGLGISVNSGSTHIGALQGGILDKRKSAWHDPYIEVDDDYTGSFYSATKMNLTLPSHQTTWETDSWIPCCSGGWMDMTYSEKKDFGADAKGIFDCTCLKGQTKT